MPSYDRALWALRTWLDSWSGIGHVAVGMHRQDFDLQLTQYDDRGWRATFYTTGMEHSPTTAIGTSWERTPWHAVQGAAGLSGIACAVAQPGIRKFLIRGARDRHARAPRAAGSRRAWSGSRLLRDRSRHEY